ncbi:MAG: alanyl-tRNA editing protein, partial [Clostridia bacterium]|nr:alanyl-tRNA editing protein [Clostridia bacterium]
MTERLYYSHPVITEITARVVSCEEKDGAFYAVLERTIIFPEGGGQPADRGTLGEANVLDAHEKAGEVVHTLDRAVEPGREYTLRLDSARRADHSEQHTGEHILSGLAHKLFGAHNVGFHMAADYCTIDLDRFFDEDELALLEAEANAAVRRSLPVTEVHTDEAGLASLTIRKKSEAAVGDIRIVYIGGGEIDSCTCCGTHCASTGEVGYIRITDSQKYKGGVRIWFSCGGRAVREANALSRSMTELARSYSTSREELPAVIEKQINELAALKAELKQKSALLTERTAKALLEGAPRAGDTPVICESL